jgi:hypothetical protein
MPEPFGFTRNVVKDRYSLLTPSGFVPSYLPGKSPFLGEFARTHGIPLDAANGGAETTYPEYQATLRALIAAGKGGAK